MRMGRDESYEQYDEAIRRLNRMGEKEIEKLRLERILKDQLADRVARPLP
jgi:histone H3/H4